MVVDEEWVLIRITDPIRWSERLKWIEQNCSQWQDHTCWPGWQIGYTDIEIYVPTRDAVKYFLRWS